MSCGRPWNKSNSRKAKELSIFYFNGTIVPFNDFTTTTEKKKVNWIHVGGRRFRGSSWHASNKKERKKKRRDT